MSYLQTSPDHNGAPPTTSAPATTSPPLHHHADDDDEDDEDDDEDDDDLRKTTGEETFQQILQCPSDKHKAYDQQDFTDHRQSSLHAHIPRSTAHPDGKKKQSNKNRKGAVQRRGSASSAGPTIEEDKEEEGEEEEETDSTPPWPEATPTELTRVATESLPSAQSHRSEDVPGACRHLVRKSAKDQVVHATKETVGRAPSCVRKLDHTPNQVLVELKELVMEHQEAQWRGTFRWMKFDDEEDEDTNVWRKPPISSLTFRSLLELRHNITHGAVLLDVQQRSLAGIAQQVVEHMLTSGHISPEDSQLLLTTLLLKHTDSINIPASSLMLAHHNNHTTGQSHASVTQPLRNGGGTNGIDTPHEKAPAGQHSRSKHELKIPHNAEATVVLVGSVGFLEQPSMAFVRLQEAVVLESVLELPVPVRFIFLLLGPPTSNMDFHEVGRTISTLMSDKNFHAAAYLADQRQDLLTAVNRFLDASVVLPPSEVGGDAVSPLRRRDERNGRETPRESKSFVDEELFVASKPPSGGGEDPLQRSGRVFGGLVKDVVRRYPQYLSDITDALNPQCLAAVIFIYFAALSPAITFGGLLGEKTDGLIGVSELIVATSIQGLVFSVFSAQPLLIVGFSGPLLVFEEAYYSFCKANGMDYLTGRAWIGIWLIVIVIATVALEGSFLVRYVSRFTQEIFSFLISLIFIYETFAKLVKIFQEHPLRGCHPGNGYPSNETVPWIGCNSSNASFPGTVPEQVSGQPNIALLSLVLMSGTYFIAFYLRMFKNSPFFPGTLRRIIGDFGVPIAILIMVLIDGSIKDTETQKLSVPSGFSVSSPEKRGWVISLLGSDGQFPVWMMAASILPAILVFILLFMESQITALICSKSERMLVKGTGFHLDLLIIVIVGGVSALFGLPWLSAATVRSVTHTNALTVMTKGDKPRIQEVKEQRVTNFLVALLVGLSIVVGDLLRQIPLAVLFGIFLYMGVMSLNGIQLTDRLLLLLMPPKYHPDLTYIRKVRTLRMHLWTIIQIVCLGVLWAVMSSSAALAFPFILLLTIPVKMLILPRVFTRTELQCLDADDAEPKLDEDAGLDEYSERHMPV